MGLYDNVNFKMDCPNCDQELDTFQSKNGECVLDNLEPSDVDNFYSSCPCGVWIEFNALPIVCANFTMSISGSGKKYKAKKSKVKIIHNTLDSLSEAGSDV